MHLPRRQFLGLAAGATALAAAPRRAFAQSYPARPVRMIVGFPAGASADSFARLMGQWLSERLGRAVVIENRPGAGGNLATDAVAGAAADGYTLLWLNAGNATSAILYDNLKFNLVRDIAPVAGVVRTIFVLVVHPSVPARSVPELIAYARSHPGKLNLASGGTGTALHLYGELFKMMAGIDVVQVHYRGDAPALTDLIGGQVQAMFAGSAAIEHVKAGELRALAVTSAERWEAMPYIPTVAESVPGYEATGWQGVGAPKNTPAEIIGRLNREINAGLADPTLKARFADLGVTVIPGSPAEFGKLLAEETEKWGKVIRAANIKPE
jgi:tripartite-type tricarboxylate transporter receptor subunit TctC